MRIVPIEMQMQKDVIIEQMQLSERVNVLSFLETAYLENPRQSEPDFWDWHFRQPPFSEDENLPVWLAKSGDRIAGQLAAIPVELNVGGKSCPAIWILDLIVDPDFRRMGIAQRLVQAAEEYCPYILGVNTNEQHAPALLQKQGFVIVTKIQRFHKLLFPGEAFREVSKLGPLRPIANLAFVPFRSGLKSETQVRTVTEFDESFDRFCAEARQQWPCSVSRSAAMLKWQFEQQPNKKYEILGYFENDRLLGYAVLFFRKPNKHGAVEKAAISDICYGPEDRTKVIDALLRASLKLAVDRRAGGLVTDALDPMLQERLRHFGFWPVKSGLQLMVKAPEQQDLLYDGSNWFLTRGDSDISIFEHPNI